MKKVVTVLFAMFLGVLLKAQETEILGVVLDEHKKPLSFVNVYLDGTLDGSSTDQEGCFVIKTEEEGVVVLKASFVGYETFSISKKAGDLRGITIYMKPAVENLTDVIIVAGNYALKSSTLESQQAIDLITTAGSNGDLNRALTMLPGAQIPGTDGKLQVRGGTSRESQTFIDGMHVLSPYSAASPNSPSRSKYSSFHFEGIHFSTGGYGSEYSQSLSSILPLETKDKNPDSMYGIALMNVNAEAGATRAWNKGSASLTATYTDLTFYQATLCRDEKDVWDIPYQDFSLRKQLRFNINPETTLKTYCGYDKTRFRRWWENPFGDDRRNMNYDEDNLYLNTTFHTQFSNRVRYFAGIAYSWNNKKIDNSLLSGDRYAAKESEIHLKTKASKRFTNLYKVEVGAESYLKFYDMAYADQYEVRRKYDHHISGIFLSNDFNLSSRLFLNLSGRMEYTSLTDRYAILPRAALNYQVDGLVLSAVIGKYQQATDHDYLVWNEKLSMETNRMTLFGLYYQKNSRIYRAEFYHKKYDHLPLITDGVYTSGGYGYSQGIDLYFDDKKLLKNFEYILTYSYNDSKRKYLDYPEEVMPDFTTRHNASLSVKYSYWKWRSIFSMTNRLASGRPYHNPNKDGFMNGRTSAYHTLDLSLTVLPHPKVIVYACLSNVFNRKNVYGYSYADLPDARGHYASVATTMYENQAFYIGVFINIGKNQAYKPSYF